MRILLFLNSEPIIYSNISRRLVAATRPLQEELLEGLFCEIINTTAVRSILGNSHICKLRMIRTYLVPGTYLGVYPRVEPVGR